MAFAALTSIFTTGGLLSAPVTALGLIPLLALGINFYRYQNVDPEARPIDAARVNELIIASKNIVRLSFSNGFRSFSLWFRRFAFNTILLWSELVRPVR